jgi:hypothetical protein
MGNFQRQDGPLIPASNRAGTTITRLGKLLVAGEARLAKEVRSQLRDRNRLKQSSIVDDDLRDHLIGPALRTLLQLARATIMLSVYGHTARLDRPRPFVDLGGDELGKVFGASARDRRNILTNRFEAFTDERQIKGSAQGLIKVPDGGVPGYPSVEIAPATP